jgi:hypothetical protein
MFRKIRTRRAEKASKVVDVVNAGAPPCGVIINSTSKTKSSIFRSTDASSASTDIDYIGRGTAVVAVSKTVANDLNILPGLTTTESDDEMLEMSDLSVFAATGMAGTAAATTPTARNLGNGKVTILENGSINSYDTVHGLLEVKHRIELDEKDQVIADTIEVLSRTQQELTETKKELAKTKEKLYIVSSALMQHQRRLHEVMGQQETVAASAVKGLIDFGISAARYFEF